jgi:hypothetical protein
MLRPFTLLTITLLTLIGTLAGCATLPLAPRTADTSLIGDNSLIPASKAETACAVTTPAQDEPPKDPNADPFGFGNWHINADRTLWVGIPPSGVWQTGGEKVIWIRPAGSELTIRGERLDAQSAPLVADIPCCYPTGFQVTGLHFPTTGCWEVEASAGKAELRFVIEVRDSQAYPPQRGIDPASPLARSVLMQSCYGSQCELQPYDTTLGTMMAEYAPISIGNYGIFGVSGDLTQLAIIRYRGYNHLQNGELSFVDLATWQQVTTTLTFDGAYQLPLFSPDNARLLVVTQSPTPLAHHAAHLIDVASGIQLVERELDFYPLNYQFTADGSGIMLFGNGGAQGATAHAALLDAQDLTTLWHTELPELRIGQEMPDGSKDINDAIWWQPAAVFAPQASTLYLVHADADQLTTIDFRTQSLATRALVEPLSWVEQLLMLTAATAHAKVANGVTKEAVLSPDGTQLYVTGTRYGLEEDKEFVQRGLGLQIIDLATGEVRAEIASEAQSVMIDAAHGRIFLHGWTTDKEQPYTGEWTEIVEIYDIETLEPIKELQNEFLTFARRLDGTPILLGMSAREGRESEYTVLDPATFEVISRSTTSPPGGMSWVTLR